MRIKIPFYSLIVLIVLMVTTDSFARYNPSWKWKTYRGEYFTIYYPEGHEDFAKRVYAIESEVYRDVTGYFGVNPPKCPVVLNPGTDIFNGSYSMLPNRISLFETPLYSFKEFGPTSDMIDIVFSHEFTHFTHITTRLGWYGLFTRIAGEGLGITNGITPGWVIEGITTNNETKFTDGGRGRSPYFRGMMMSFTEGKGLWGLSSAATSPPYSPPGERIYLAGYFMVDYLNRTYGDDAFARMSALQARRPFGGTRRALGKVTGVSPKKFYNGFLDDFEKMTEDIKSKADMENLPAGDVLFYEQGNSIVSHFWKDNKTIQGLISGYEKKTSLVDIDVYSKKVCSEKYTGQLANLTPVRRTKEGKLLYGEVVYHHLGEAELDRTNLSVYDPVHDKRIRIKGGEHIYSADLSPDLKTFVAAKRNGMWIDLVTVNAHGSGCRTLVSKPGVCWEAPCWSPDGSMIAAVLKIDRKTDIALVNPVTGEYHTLYRPDIFEETSPAFSPDGRWIIFSSSRNGIFNIYAFDLAGERLFQLTSVYYGAYDPRVSPDCGSLSFLSLYRGVYQIRIMPFDPEKGKEIRIEPAGEPEKPNLARYYPDVNPEAKGIPFWEAYKPFVHTPFYTSDEDGDCWGLYIVGSDPLGINAYSADVHYGVKSERTGYDFSFTNKSFWPVIGARLYDTAEDGNTVGGGKAYWFRERGGELSLGMNILDRVSPTTVFTEFRAGARFRKFEGLGSIKLKPENDRSVSYFGELTIINRPDTAAKDMTAGWGQSLLVNAEKALEDAGGELPGHNLLVIFEQGIPGPLRHTGFSARLSYQNQNGLLYYDRTKSIPRGYDYDDTEGGLSLRNDMTTSLEYHFPILFTDCGLGLMAFHPDIVKGSLFVDYGAGWTGDFSMNGWSGKARTSYGGTLTLGFKLMAYIPLEAGIMAGYNPRDDEHFSQFILSLGF